MGALKEFGVIFVWGIYQFVLYLETLVVPSIQYTDDENNRVKMDISKIAKNLVKSVSSGEVRTQFSFQFRSFVRWHSGKRPIQGELLTDTR